MEPITQTVADTERYLGFKRTKIFDLLREGKLQRVKIGRKTLVTVESAKALIAASLIQGGV